MSKNTGTLIGAQVRITDSNDTYPATHAQEMQGGHYPALTLTDRDNIPAWLRLPGMTCGVSADNSLWQLDNDLVTWHSAGGSGGGGSFGAWTPVVSKNPNILLEYIDLEYKIDVPTDQTKTTLHLRGQFSLDSSLAVQILTLGVLPAGARPKGLLKRTIQANGVDLYLMIHPVTGEITLVSKNGFNLPVGTSADQYTIETFYKPIIAGSGGTTTYTSIHTQKFFRNNCGAGFSGTSVSFSRTYTSTISQADADAQNAADSTFATDGQAYANLNGMCTVIGGDGTIRVTNTRLGVTATVTISTATGTVLATMSAPTGVTTTTVAPGVNYSVRVQFTDLDTTTVQVNADTQQFGYSGNVVACDLTFTGENTPINVTI